MCGVFGWFDKDNTSDAGQRRMLAWISQSRGIGGLGGLAFTSNGPIAWKDGISVADFCKDSKYTHPFGRYNQVMMHNRRPSPSISGSAVSAANSHPFQVGHITMAHNGFIQNHEEIAQELAKDDKYKELVKHMKVDSHILCAALDKWGVKIFKEVRGKAAVWFYDDRIPDKAYFWLWDQDFAMDMNGGIFFASELDTLLASGFYGASKMMDKGNIIEIDINNCTAEEVGVIKGDDSPKVIASSTYTPTKDNYEYGIPPKLLDVYKEDGAKKDLEDAFRLMQGQFVGYCPHCQQFLKPYDCAIARMDDDGNFVATGGTPVMIHREYSKGQQLCGKIIHCLTKSRSVDILANYIKYDVGDGHTFLNSMWTSTNPKRQISLRDAENMVKNTQTDFGWEIYDDDSKKMIEFYKSHKGAISSATRGLQKSQVYILAAEQTDTLFPSEQEDEARIEKAQHAGWAG